MLQVDASRLHRNTPVSARMWCMQSNAAHVTRSISVKLVDALVTDLGNIRSMCSTREFTKKRRKTLNNNDHNQVF